MPHWTSSHPGKETCDLKVPTVNHTNIWNVKNLEELYPRAKKIAGFVESTFEMANQNKSYDCPNLVSSHIHTAL